MLVIEEEEEEEGRIRLRCRAGRWHDDVYDIIYDIVLYLRRNSGSVRCARGPRCNTCARRWTCVYVQAHTGAIEACNEPRVTRGQPVTELIRRRASATHVAPACSDINLRFLRSWMDPCSVFLKKILSSSPLIYPRSTKNGWNRGLDSSPASIQTFLSSSRPFN